jgi:hypothetical protein
MSGSGSELAVREGTVITPAERAASATALADAGSIDSWLVVMKDVVLLAEHIAGTSFVPKAYRGDAPAVAAAILAGRELGLQPMTALRHVQVVEGSPGLSAEYKRARVLSAGHKLDITEHTTEACTVTGHRKGHQSVTVRYTMKDARTAGLVKARGAWETRPRRMLFARAATEVCDALFSDLTNGLPTAELLEEEADWESARSAESVREGVADEADWRRQRVTAADARARAPQTVTATVETVTPEPSPAAPESPRSVPTATPADVAAAGEADNGPAPDDPEYRRAMNAAQAQLKRFAAGDTEAELSEAKRILAARILRVEAVASMSNLTVAELRTISNTCGSATGSDSAAQLEALLTKGEVPGE